MKRTFLLLLVLLAGSMLLVINWSTNSATAQIPDVDGRLSHAVQLSFPSPIPVSYRLTVRGGWGQILFSEENPEFFGAEEGMHERMQVSAFKILAMVTDLKGIDIVLPYDRHIVSGTWTRRAYEMRGETKTVDTVRMQKN